MIKTDPHKRNLLIVVRGLYLLTTAAEVIFSIYTIFLGSI